ncbi:unnamed protein product [Leptidea sinapis]|uniref:dihydrofolate reductase n=1 Tax=Leptidea sinapis TaxID=189913 RepID=A0A5E4R5H2_9NEOP|nr:unnamed protein product [Leptidea sinapis]
MCSNINFNVIAAVSDNRGIGDCGGVPWRINGEVAFFKMTTIQTRDPKKKNAVIIGRVSWECIPPKYRPLERRLNVILTRNVDQFKQSVAGIPDIEVAESFDKALAIIEQHPNIESTWVIGGGEIYKLALEHPNCNQIYITDIKKTFQCDTFFPDIDMSKFKLAVVTTKNEQNSIEFYHNIFKKIPNADDAPEN